MKTYKLMILALITSINTFGQSKGNSAQLNDRFMYLNAVDFDFTNNKAGYVGHFNIYSPPPKDRFFGFNAGILKINYTNNDSIMRTRTDSVKIKPLDELSVGSKYLRQFNEYKRKVKNTSFSIYFQPLLELPTTGKSKLLIHGHIELLVTKYETTTFINTLQQDTTAISIIEDIPEDAHEILNKKNVTSQTLLNGYFGGGITGDLYFTDTARLFVQGTIGSTTNSPHPSSVNGNFYYKTSDERNWHGFYLIRAYFRYKMTKGSELILGTDIRGLLPRYEPYYAVYAGINLTIDKITDLFNNK